jgi:hypothetical protein
MWILIAVITTLHLQGGIKSVDVTTHDFQSKASCERTAEQITAQLRKAEVLPRVEVSHSCLKK